MGKHFIYCAIRSLRFLSGCFFLIFIFLFGTANAQETLSNYTSLRMEGRSIIIETDSGQKLRVTPYGKYIIRVQAARQNEKFFPDTHYDMVETHSWPGNFLYNDNGNVISIYNNTPIGLNAVLTKTPVRLSFSPNYTDGIFLRDSLGIVWNDNSISAVFENDSSEHFAGLGHGYFGRVDKLDLQGEIVERNYGTKHHQQAPLIVPFYLSSKGYGIFLNSTFPNSFSFGKDGHYSFTITGGGQMDYFVIAGPEFEKILDRYTQLTGRPRFPPKAAFGLALSDKGNDHTSTDPSDENWWKRKIKEHRLAGFPIDHVVNDNRWRAGGGQRCESFFDWDKERYPDPGEYKRWLDSNGLFITLDFNRCIASRSDGWRPEYNLPNTDSIAFGESAPDLTKKEVRDWWWNLFWTKSLNPTLKFPGDALWIDEFDEMANSPMSMVLGNGRTWMEMKNYWFFLVAQALVRDGWDASFKGSRRPFVWVRGMTAGAQRYATLWSGDIIPTYDEMKTQVRGMLAAGLSGFPFWGHDAGAFFNYDLKDGPDDNMYRQWSMAFGSFTPYWKPHGPGKSRWPLDRAPEVKADAKVYSELRYKLMPYLYSYASTASSTGMPVARAMIIDYQDEPQAWNSDLQYMWGKELLVAPNCSDNNPVSVWLPEGSWYNYWNDSLIAGNRIIKYSSTLGQLPLFVKAGSIIPMCSYALSTAFIPGDSLTLHVYTGGNASFELYEDDGHTEGYLKNEKRLTGISFNQDEMTLIIDRAKWNYKNAPKDRHYIIVYHGLQEAMQVSVNGNALDKGIAWDEKAKTLTVTAGSFSVNEMVVIKKI